MVGAGNVLFDNRAFVQVGRHVMRGGTNDFYATVKRLLVRPCAFKAWQKRVVDVDGAAVQVLAQVVRQHLHVARQNHQLGLLVGHQFH